MSSSDSDPVRAVNEGRRVGIISTRHRALGVFSLFSAQLGSLSGGVSPSSGLVGVFAGGMRSSAVDRGEKRRNRNDPSDGIRKSYLGVRPANGKTAHRRLNPRMILAPEGTRGEKKRTATPTPADHSQTSMPAEPLAELGCRLDHGQTSVPAKLNHQLNH